MMMMMMMITVRCCSKYNHMQKKQHCTREQRIRQLLRVELN